MTRFSWDPRREWIDIHKHGVDFVTASKAFRDPQRKIFEDTRHGEKERRFMKKRDKDWEMPKGKLTRVKDFLPPPSELVMPEETLKVTISLNRSSVEFFKRQAERYHTKYQKMIRQLLDRYVSQYQTS